jgi:membrane protease YdiL (CAAX protease family)
MWGTLLELLIQILTFCAIGAGAYALTRLLRFRRRDWPFADPKRVGIQATAVVLLGWVLLTVYLVSASSFVSLIEPHPSVRVYAARDIGVKLFRSVLAFGPLLVFMIWRRESWASARVSKHNLYRSLLVGGILAGLIVASVLGRFGGDSQTVLTRLTTSHLWALAYYSLTGLVEELAFRGFLQTRVSAWLGRVRGVAFVAGLMSLAHIPQRIYVSGMAFGDAIVSSVALIPINLLFGHIMLQTENVVAPGLFHVFVDWSVTLT